MYCCRNSNSSEGCFSYSTIQEGCFGQRCHCPGTWAHLTRGQDNYQYY
nr:hypothetical protein Iba_chr07dCG9130 [Ipomoea batatas]